MNGNKLKYAIVGGGATGCTLAWHLTHNGHDVHLFERENGLGGLASGIPYGNTELDRFYHHIFTSDTVIQSYIDQVGLTDKLKWCKSSVGYEHQGVFYPFVSPMDLLKFKPLSFLSRIRVGLSVLKMRRRDTYKDLENITAEEFIIRDMGENAYRVLWEPLLRSKFGECYRQVSAVWFWGKVKLRGGTRSKSGGGECLGYLKDGWEQLYRRMGEKIQQRGGKIHLREAVEEIRPTHTGLDIETKKGTDTFDRVIVTPSIRSFIQMTPSLSNDYKSIVDRIPYQANITMILGLNRPLSPFYWLNVTDPDSPFVAVIDHRKLFDDPDYGLLYPIYLSRYLSVDHPYFQMNVPQVKDIFLTHLERLFPDFKRENLKKFSFSKSEFAQPVIGLNYSRFKPSFQTPIDGLYLCTMVQIYPEDRGMNYSFKIAEECLKQLDELKEFAE